MRSLLSRSLGLLRLSARDPRILEGTLKAVTLLIGVTYIAGLFIVNFNLSMYGLRGFGLVRAEYVVAGGLWLFLTGFCYLLWRNVAAPLVVTGLSISRRIASALGRTVLSGVMLLFVFVVITAPSYGYGLRGLAVLAGATALVSLILIYPAAVVLALVGTEDGTRRDSPLFVLPFTLIFLVATWALYSVAIYPTILPAYGGGAPIPVRVLLTKSASADVRAKLAEIDGSASSYLLADTSDWLILVPRPHLTFMRKLTRSIRVRRDDVEMIVVVPPN